jgi:thiol-disulfide isomerase/thioredoxin
MKKLFLVLTIVITMALSDGYGQNRSIQFSEKPWSEILAQAKQEKKLIFMDAFASWCGPCKWMAANMFTRDSVADYYNKTFICTHFDMEKGEGVALRSQYNVTAYPSLLYINPDGEMVHKKVGAAPRIKDYLDMAITAQNPEECLAAYNKKYNDGNLSGEFIARYLGRLADAYIPSSTVMQKYFATQMDDQLLSRDNWNIIYRYVSDENSQEFKWLLNHHKDYAAKYTNDSVNSKISDVFYKSLMARARYSNMTDESYNEAKKKIKDSGFEGADKIIFLVEMSMYKMRGNNQKFVRLVYDGLDKYYGNDWTMLNSIAQAVVSITDSVKYLEKAKSWAERSIKINSLPDNNDTYAAILYKLGRKEEAIKTEKEALRLATLQNIDVKKFEDAIAKMEAN